jgi:hypothetical protein
MEYNNQVCSHPAHFTNSSGKICQWPCHSLKIRLWVRRIKGEIWLASQRTAISQKLSSFC